MCFVVENVNQGTFIGVIIRFGLGTSSFWPNSTAHCANSISGNFQYRYGDLMPAKVTGRTVFRAAILVQRNRERFGISGLYYTSGPVKPDIERYIDAGRITQDENQRRWKR